jgi:hypothetical protein
MVVGHEESLSHEIVSDGNNTKSVRISLLLRFVKVAKP